MKGRNELTDFFGEKKEVVRQFLRQVAGRRVIPRISATNLPLDHVISPPIKNVVKDGVVPIFSTLNMYSKGEMLFLTSPLPFNTFAQAVGSGKLY